MIRREVLSSAGLGLLALALPGGEAALADQVTLTFLHCNDVYEISHPILAEPPDVDAV